MPYNLPHPITGQKDLEYYERFLKKDNFRKVEIPEPETFYNILSQNCGKNIRIEMFSGYKIGQIKELGSDFLILKNKNSMTSTLIPLSKILSVTFLRGN